MARARVEPVTFAVLISFVNEIVIVLDVHATVAGEYIGLSGSSRLKAIMLAICV
jgi:hypothetical protein